jgi:hypothetical protein
MTADPMASNSPVWRRGEISARLGLVGQAARKYRLWAAEERAAGHEDAAGKLDDLAAAVDAYTLTCAALACGGGY